MTPDGGIARFIEMYTVRCGLKPSELRLYRQERHKILSTNGGCFRLLGEFIAKVVECRAGDDRKMTRRFYEGAFAFGDRTAVRLQLLQCCAAQAYKYFLAGEHQLVWRLMDLVHEYPPDGMDSQAILDYFTSAGVYVSCLRRPKKGEPLWRMMAAKPNLPQFAYA